MSTTARPAAHIADTWRCRYRVPSGAQAMRMPGPCSKGNWCCQVHDSYFTRVRYVSDACTIGGDQTGLPSRVMNRHSPPSLTAGTRSMRRRNRRVPRRRPQPQTSRRGCPVRLTELGPLPTTIRVHGRPSAPTATGSMRPPDNAPVPMLHALGSRRRNLSATTLGKRHQGRDPVPRI